MLKYLNVAHEEIGEDEEEESVTNPHANKLKWRKKRKKKRLNNTCVSECEKVEEEEEEPIFLGKPSPQRHKGKTKMS